MLTPKQAHAATAAFSFYDLESLSNVFTNCVYTPSANWPAVGNALDIFYLCDDLDISAILDAPVEGKRQILGRDMLITRVRDANKALPEQLVVRLWDLRTEQANARLAQMIGASCLDDVCDMNSSSKWANDFPPEWRPVCDTDPGYDPEKHPFIAGYNSLNYDSVMLACYLDEAFPSKQFRPTTAAAMRAHNDALFSDQHRDNMARYLEWGTRRAVLRQSMLRSGRHIDVSQLNEAQRYASLKRLSGMIGRQIKESDKLSHNTVITTFDEFCDLIAYNVSDTVALSFLFRRPEYSEAFDLKADLLTRFCETRFTAWGKPRRDRLAPDSTSAKFVSRILAPGSALEDIPVVSFVYPHPDVAKQRGIASADVLEESLAFFRREIAPDPEHDESQKNALDAFMEIYRYYDSIRGKNFNNSDAHLSRNMLETHDLKAIPKTANNIPYYRKDESGYVTPTSCFVTFSTGGIHGAEAETHALRAAETEHHQLAQALHLAKMAFKNDPCGFTQEAKRQHDWLILPDGSGVSKSLVLIGSTPANVKWRKPTSDPGQREQLERAKWFFSDPADVLALQRPSGQALYVWLNKDMSISLGITDPSDPRRLLDGKNLLAKTTLTTAQWKDLSKWQPPQLFKAMPDGSTKLDGRYTHTSVGLMAHEDFISYYPGLLNNLKAFYNPELGEDRYAELFEEKESLGREMKNHPKDSLEWQRLYIRRNGVKLLLNAASGGADMAYDNTIRMNNTIISMRIIGQLLAWRVGQAQTLAGASIVSTNTDGLYPAISPSYSLEQNESVLATVSASIGIPIEAEPLALISKDSNNRAEFRFDPDTDSPSDFCGYVRDPARRQPGDVLSAGGGTLACHNGPDPRKSLAHPAATDAALISYLRILTGRVLAGETDCLYEPFDPVLGRACVEELIDFTDPVRTLTFFQNIIVSSGSPVTHPFATDVTPQGVSDPMDPALVAGLGPRPSNAQRRCRCKDDRPE